MGRHLVSRESDATKFDDQLSALTRTLATPNRSNMSPSPRNGSISPNKQKREASLNSLEQRRLSAAPASYSHGREKILSQGEEHSPSRDEDIILGEAATGDASIFNKFKQ